MSGLFGNSAGAASTDTKQEDAATAATAETTKAPVENTAETAPTDAPKISELDMLKQRATLMGIDFSNNIGVETLRKRIDDKLEGKAPEPEVKPEETTQINALTGEPAGNEPEAFSRDKLIREQMKLVRLRITNLDPKKKDLPGEIFTVANEYIGTVRRYIPFGEMTDEGWHVEYCLYKMLEARQFLNIRTRKGKNGVPVVESGYVREFALEILPDLTQEDLNRLATAQAAAGSIAA